MKGKICIVTGANSGIGKETAKQLAELDAHVVMVVRNEEKGQKALIETKEETKKDSLDLMICDFASQKSIRNFVSEFMKKYKRLDVLVNNHGVMLPKKQLTENGLESTFAINYLGYFLLTNLLLEIIKSSSPSRIVNVSSGSFAAVRKIHLDDYNFDKRRYSLFKAYSESKLYINMFTYTLAERLKKANVTVTSFSPGYTRTNLGSTSLMMKITAKLSSFIADSSEKAAKHAIYLATSPEIDGVTGKYFYRYKIKEPTRIASNKQLQEELWELSEKLTEAK